MSGHFQILLAANDFSLCFVDFIRQIERKLNFKSSKEKKKEQANNWNLFWNCVNA